MKMHSFKFLCLYSMLIFFTNSVFCEKGSTWAILHVGGGSLDDYYTSYGMEAAIYRLYNILVRNNIPRSNIITISPDVAAYHSLNPLQGVVVYATSGNPYTAVNQYEDVQIDYHPKDLNEDLFFDILRGNDTMLKNVTGSGKVLKTEPQDRVFFFTVSVGTYGALLLGPNTILYANTFIPQLEKLKQEKRFAKMLMVVDAEKPGSMFDDYLDTSKNIIVYTTGGRYSSFNLIERNELIKAYTGTLGSKIFINSLEQLVDNESTIFDHYILAKNEALINTDPINLYGTLRLGREKISNFIGTRPFRSSNFQNTVKVQGSEESKSDFVKLDAAFEESGTIEETDLVTLKYKLQMILTQSLVGSQYSVEDLETIRPNLPLGKYDCYRSALEGVHASCFTGKNQIILLTQAEKLARMCELGIESEKIVQIARRVCKWST